MARKNDPEKEGAKKESSQEYTAENIKVLQGLEAVRKRPAMYIGSTGVKASQAALSPAGEWLATGTYYGAGVKI